MSGDHERIWLQNAEDAKHQCEGRLWCQDKVWPDHHEDSEPTEYVRADLFEALRERLEEVERECQASMATIAEERARAEAAEARVKQMRDEQITNALSWRDLAKKHRTALERIVTAHDSYIDTNRYAVENPDWLDDEINAARRDLADVNTGKGERG